MLWTETARRAYVRASTRYTSDLSDREWDLVKSFLPPPKSIGRPRTVDLRDVINAILDMANRTDANGDFKVLPKCWRVERTLA